MCAFAASRSPASVARAAIVPLLVLAVALCEAGCATDNNANYAGAPATVAYARPATAGVEIEDDGLPSQTPPAANIRQLPDDPSEPYSRNYGGPNPASIRREPAGETASKPSPVQLATIPADLPPAFRRQLAMAGYVTE
jgi:hypothetical protein